MKRSLTGFLSLSAMLVVQLAQGQDVDLNINSVPASLQVGQTGIIEVRICNLGLPDINAPVNRLRPLLSVGNNVEIIGYDNTDFTLVQNTTGTGNSFMVLYSKSLPFSECATVNFTVRGTVVGPNSISTATLGFNGPQTTGNDPDNDNSTTGTTVTAAMPISLVGFTAQVQDDRTVSLDWTTSFESNNKGFLVERSKDLKTFEKVGEVGDVAANSSALKNYRLIDQTPYSSTSYYRLTQTDLNGKATTFPVKSVVIRDTPYGVYPNPVVHGQPFVLRLDEPVIATINLLSVEGRVLPIQKLGVESGNLLLKTAENLSSGVYVLTVQERGQTRKHRLIVQ